MSPGRDGPAGGERRFEVPPLQRHPTLQPLSREHMGGLVQARNLIAAAEHDDEARRRAVEEFVGLWRAEVREHFDDEERMLLPVIRDPEQRERLLREHMTLRALAAWCERDPGAMAMDRAAVGRLGQLLHDHIRWEERVLFEAVQRDDPAALMRMSEAAVTIESSRPGSRARGGQRSR